MNKNVLLRDYLQCEFTLNGKFTGLKFIKKNKLDSMGEGANIFEVYKIQHDEKCNSDNNIFIAKHYNFGLSKYSIENYKKLGNNDFTECLYDYSVVKLSRNFCIYFGIFNKIQFNYEYIPGFFNIDTCHLHLKKALEYVHSCNIMHGDIKPNNIMCSRENVKLIDFEFSCTLDSIKPRGKSCLAYRHPKSIENKNLVSKNIDNWAMIVSLYEIYFQEDFFVVTGDSDDDDEKIFYNIILDKMHDDVVDNKDIFFINELKKYID
jgi:serine/threonine protein kinase